MTGVQTWLSDLGVPVSIRHGPQTGLPVWQFIHKLETPIANPKVPLRPHTHICVLCSADAPTRVSRRTRSWENALMRQRMTTNAVAHLQRVHPDEFVAVEEYKKRKRESLSERKGGQAPKKQRARKQNSTATRAVVPPVEESRQPNKEATEVTIMATQPAIKSRAGYRSAKAAELVNTWLISAGLPLSVVQNNEFRQLLKSTASSALPTASELNARVREEFTKFGALLKEYLASEFHTALDLPFLSLRHGFRPIAVSAEEEGQLTGQRKALLSVSIGFIDSHWTCVDFSLAARVAPQDWDEEINQLITQTLSDAYGIQNPWDYVRFEVSDDDHSPSPLTIFEDNVAPGAEQEDQLTRTLRGCVLDALGLGTARDSFSQELDVRRILRLLQHLLKCFAATDRANALRQIGKAHDVVVPVDGPSRIDDLVHSTTSVGAVAELLRLSCSRYRAYCLYFQAPSRPDVDETGLEAAWMQLSKDDWQTVTELEALLNQLGQFGLEGKPKSRPAAIASYSLLFRRLLTISMNASSLKCLVLDDIDDAGATKHPPQRKARRIDIFTPTGRQCLAHLHELIRQHFAPPSTPEDIDNEIKAMLLDPRINAKAANLVTDSRVLRRAQEALRQEHRIIFEELAARDAPSIGNVEVDGETEDDDEDEMSALLMLDGPKSQSAGSVRTTTATRIRQSSSALLEEEARAWSKWQQVFVAWDALADEGADLLDKGQYNLLKLYHHVDILKWFRDVGQQAHPAAALLARTYLGQQQLSFPPVGPSLLRFTQLEDADWVSDAAQRAEQRCILHHNWQQYKRLHAAATR